MHTIISSFRYQLSAAFFLCIIINVTWQQQQSWQIDVGTSAARVFTTTLRESESAQIDGKLTTFQWSLPHSIITLPPHSQPQIISLRTIMRAESPPHAVTLSNANLQFALATTTGVRRYAFYSTHGAQFAIDCDMQGVSDSALAKICIAIDTINGQPTNSALDWPVLGWMLVLISALTGVAWMIATPAHPWQIIPLVAIGVTLLWSFPLQCTLFAPQLSLGMGGLAVVLWGIQRWVVGGWRQIAGQAMALNIAIKGLGVLVPGYFGTDVFFHVNRFVATFSGRLYQVADGQGQTYPYTPGVYQLIAPVMLPLMTLFPADRVIIVSAVIIDSSTILILAWMCQRLAWSQRSITLMAWLYVVLPAGFLLQWQATIAQNVGQWLGMMAIATSLFVVTPVSLVWMAWAVVGHFGAFLTLHFANTLALGFPALRRMGLWWWGVVGVMGVVFYSQYAGLIQAQLQQLGGNSADIGWEARWWQFAWHYGLYGHYLGIGIALAIIGLALAPRDRWWQMAVAMLVSAGVLLVAQVVIDFGATRYVIFIFPVVASYAGLALGRLRRGRAGQIMLIALLGLIALQSGLAWLNGAVLGIRIGYLW